MRLVRSPPRQSSFSMQVAFRAVCGGRCLAAEASFTNRIQRSSGQITGLQIGGRQETKGFVLFLEAGQRLVKVFRETLFENRARDCAVVFFGGGGRLCFWKCFYMCCRLLSYYVSGLPHSCAQHTHTHTHSLSPSPGWPLSWCLIW